MNRSISKKLLVLISGAFIFAWLVISVWVYTSSKYEVEEVYDAHLAQTAKLILMLVRHNIDHLGKETIVLDESFPVDHKYEAKVAFTLWNSQGDLITHSPNAPVFPKMEEPLGYKDVVINGESWHIFGLRCPNTGSVVQTGQHYQVREEMVVFLTTSILPAMLLSLPIVFFLVKLSIGKGLSPLRKLTGDIICRRPGQLDPVAKEHVPEEVEKLVVAINDLFGRLQYAFESEQRFTADAAHELRTPLAGIKTQAQLALRSTDSSQKKEALINILAGVERTTRLVSQLLTLARLDAENAFFWERFELKKVCIDVIAEQGGEAVKKNIDISLEGDLAYVNGYSELALILVGNLVNNAIRYTPEHGNIIVSIKGLGDKVKLSVSDNGPGIPEDQRENVFGRFKRGEHASIAGTGLGLAIVKRIADLQSIRLELSEGIDGEGLQVSAYFERAERRASAK